ncbi:hypothetical protein BKA65DRAFT_59284 [Rhexocercosporidium sp. MPI-PUGE-AT-0058]|nr:hypothetical protein BKA65DRAFT_59284 [Rhexocercosporidium sp. MPI-PUGE-AT-0058]
MTWTVSKSKIQKLFPWTGNAPGTQNSTLKKPRMKELQDQGAIQSVWKPGPKDPGTAPQHTDPVQTMGGGHSVPKRSMSSGRRKDSSPARVRTERLRRKVSLQTLRQGYAEYEEKPSFQERCAGVIAYVKALEEDGHGYRNHLTSLKSDLEAVDNIFSDVSSSVVNWTPYDQSVRREPPEPRRIPGYIQMLQRKYDEQYNHSGRLATSVAELKAEIERLRVDVHTKGTEITRLKERNSLDVAACEAKIIQNTASHNLEIARLERIHSRTLQDLEKTHSEVLLQKQQQFEDTARKARDDHNSEKSRLQNALLTTVDGFKPLVDKACRDQLEDLRSSIHGLVFGLDNLGRDNPGPLRNQIAMIRNPQNKDYKNVLESCFWKVIFDGIFATPFCALGEYGNSFMETWTALFGSEQPYKWPEADTRSETWRHVTLETLEQELKGSRPSNLKLSYEANKQAVTSSLSSLYSQVSSKDKSREIRDIVDNACRLALAYGKQRCRLQLLIPGPGNPIDTRDKDVCFALNHSSDRVINEVQLVVRPGLLKVGDSRGGSFRSSTNMTPSAVYLKIAAY